MTTFSARMRERHDGLFEAFWHHPYLAGLRDGTAPPEAVAHYVGQDHQYLSAFLRCYGLGVAGSPDRDWIAFFAEQIAFVLNDEQHPHHVLCRAIGTTYEQVQTEVLAPTAQAYINHMAASAQDSLAVGMAALLPCPWTYTWAGCRAIDDELISPDNPYAGWWEFYATDDCRNLVDDFCARVDQLAADAGPAELARMETAFEASCHHEIRFWEMAWTRETWQQLPERVLSGVAAGEAQVR